MYASSEKKENLCGTGHGALVLVANLYASTRYDLLGDGLGSVRSIIDNSGAVVGTADYTMFGEYRNQTGVTSRFGFTGEYYAQETGMWHLRARDLHPNLGRFLSADPVQPNAPGTQGYNRYAYVANNPSTWVDPSGFSTTLPTGDLSLLSLLSAMGGGIADILRCANDPICRGLQGLINYLGADIVGFAGWSANLLANAFSTYPHQPTPVSPAALVFSLALSNTPVWGDIYDLVTAVTGYDFVTKQYLSGFDRLLTFAGAIPIPGISGGNLRHGVDAFESFASHGDDLARYIGKACSFDEETPVTTEDGQIPIKDVDVGDKVLAWDEVTDSTGYFLVTTTYTDVHEVLVYLTINGEQIETTPEHPFYTIDGGWTRAGELNEGDALRTIDGTIGVVDAVTFVATPRVMYNMTVADAHTYLVGDGEWVVHNACRVNYGNLDSLSRPTGVIAELSAPLPRGTKANSRILPPGWNSVSNNRARGHLLANILGGSGDDKRNLVTIAQIPINTPIMRGIERSIRNAVDAGETIVYQVTPIYRGSDLVPHGITIEAIGDQEFELALTLLNRFR